MKIKNFLFFLNLYLTNREICGIVIIDLRNMEDKRNEKKYF